VEKAGNSRKENVHRPMRRKLAKKGRGEEDSDTVSWTVVLDRARCHSKA